MFVDYYLLLSLSLFVYTSIITNMKLSHKFQMVVVDAHGVRLHHPDSSYRYRLAHAFFPKSCDVSA